jgi:signal transduction histidine kinase
LPVAALVAARVGQSIARPVEHLSEAAVRIAEGEGTAPLLAGGGTEGRKLARALSALRRGAADAKATPALLRDAWHDLKTPLAAIRATIEVLEDGAIDDPAAARAFVANLRASAEQLDRRLADLVTLARFETGALAAPRRADLADVAESVLAELEPLAVATGVSLSTEAQARVAARCDPAALTRALANLVENAIHASPGGTVRVEVDGARDIVRLHIINEPSSIPANIRPHLFERATSSRGSGLGLAIARAAIEAHGGRVRFTELGPPRVAVRIELPR